MAQWSNFASCLDLDLMIKSDFLLQMLSLIPLLQLEMSRVCWALNSGCVGSCWALNSGCVGSCWALNSGVCGQLLGGIEHAGAAAGHWTREVWAVAGHWTRCVRSSLKEMACTFHHCYRRVPPTYHVCVHRQWRHLIRAATARKILCHNHMRVLRFSSLRSHVHDFYLKKIRTANLCCSFYSLITTSQLTNVRSRFL